MKRILQAFDSASTSTKAVEGANDMAKFLKVVSEADINQQVPAMPSVAGMQPGTAKDLGDGEKLTLNQDGTVSYSGAWGTYVYNAQGQHVRTDSPSFAGYQQSTNPQGQVTNQSYNMGPLSVQQGQQGTSASYDLGVAKVSQQTNAQGQTTNTVQEGDMSKFLSIIDKNDVEFLMEGANPHKVSLPVQMAMQHYNKPVSATPAKKESLLKKYFAEAEEAIIEKKLEKSNLVKQYSQKIAARVLESKDKEVVEQQEPAPRSMQELRKEEAVLEKQLAYAEAIFAKARKITTGIKYTDPTIEIVTEIKGLVTKELNIDQRDLEMAERTVFDLMRNLESAIYELDNPFEDAVRNLKNKLDDVQTEIEEINWNQKYGRGE